MKTIIPIEWGSPEYDESVKIRTEVLRKPINMEFEIAQLEAEWVDIHLACYNNRAEMMGSLILSKYDESTYKMRQVAVSERFQKHGVGKALVEASEQYIKSNGANKIILNARELAIPFYEKLDYTIIGDWFLEVGIRHKRLEKKIDSPKLSPK